MLAELAVNDAAAFSALVEVAKEALPGRGLRARPDPAAYPAYGSTTAPWRAAS